MAMRILAIHPPAQRPPVPKGRQDLANPYEQGNAGSTVDWGTILVVVLVVAGIAGVLLLPRRKQWNADGADDRARKDEEE